MIWVLSVGPRPNLQAARISGITSVGYGIAARTVRRRLRPARFRRRRAGVLERERWTELPGRRLRSSRRAGLRRLKPRCLTASGRRRRRPADRTPSGPPPAPRRRGQGSRARRRPAGGQAEKGRWGKRGPSEGREGCRVSRRARRSATAAHGGRRATRGNHYRRIFDRCPARGRWFSAGAAARCARRRLPRRPNRSLGRAPRKTPPDRRGGRRRSTAPPPAPDRRVRTAHRCGG